MIGSVWNKWDLHLHSPLTWLENRFEKTSMKEFVDQISEAGVTAIGLTNYFYFQENELENVRAEVEKQGKKITVLGNIEFRITAPNKDGEWINLHCIFNQRLSTAAINDALGAMKVSNTTKEGLNIFCSEKSFGEAKLKVSDAVVDLKELAGHLRKTLKYGTDFVFAACPNGYGGFRANAKEGRSRAVAAEIEKECSLVFGRPQDREYFLDAARYEGAIPKPVFVASDAHQLASSGEGEKLQLGVCSRYTWVKANPTFEGLRQAIIEPDLRVQQSDGFTEQLYRKPRFTCIELSGSIFPGQQIKFSKQEIPLNPNLVTIIGGRGTGKSLLLDALRSCFNLGSPAAPPRGLAVESLKVQLDIGDGSIKTFEQSNSPYSYLHVTQGEIQKLTDTPQILSIEIKKMLGLQTTQFDPSLTDEMKDLANAYRNFVSFCNETDAEGNRINTPDFQNRIIAQNEQLIATLTNPENKSLIDRYVSNTTQINEKTIFVQEIRVHKSSLERFVAEFNASLAAATSSKHAVTPIPLLDFSGILNAINQNVSNNEATITSLGEDNHDIVAQFISLGIHQDIASLLGKIADYQFAIDSAKQKLTEIELETTKWQSTVNRRSQIVKAFLEFSVKQSKAIDTTFQELAVAKHGWNPEQHGILKVLLSDIEIFGSVTFDIDSFYAGLESLLNRGKFKATADRTTRERLMDALNVTNLSDYESLIHNEARLIVDGAKVTIENFFWKSEYFNSAGQFGLVDYLFSPSEIGKYLHVNAEFKYKGKTIDKLSVGQRGTFFVCLKLATDPFGTPFVFDQPEDDLDNEFIMDQLVPIFRAIKKYRQVILVTHNANLVVNTDAEQIIVATNVDEHIRYLPGALEHGNIPTKKGTRYQICKILEGGSPAFEKRELKYGLQIDS